MSQFQSLDDLVQASQSQSPNVVAPLPTAATSHGPKAPRSAKKRTRLTATPDFASPVSEIASGAASGDLARDAEVATQDVAVTEVVTSGGSESRTTEMAVATSAGGQESPNPVNHTQVVVSSEFPHEMQQLLARIGVNLSVRQLGRKHVLDDFLRCRLVSLLSMG